MSLNFLVRGKGDQPPQPQPDAERKALPAIVPAKGQRDRALSAVPAISGPPGSGSGNSGSGNSGSGNSGESKMTDDLHAIAALIGQLTDDPPQSHAGQRAIASGSGSGGTGTPAGTVRVEAGAREDSLLDECQATLARLESAKSNGDSLLAQIESFSNTLERQAAELTMARTSMTKLAAENGRLTNENDRLRVMLRSLLDAVDADARRNMENITAAERRLRDLGRQPAERQKQAPARGLVAEA
jgi:regulator of replication initiation timing